MIRIKLNSLRHVSYQQCFMGLKRGEKYQIEIEKIQNQSLKKILPLLVTSTSNGMLMETGILPEKGRIE